MMANVRMTEEQLRERKRIQKRKRRLRDRERALDGKPRKGKKLKQNIQEYYLAKEVADSADEVIRTKNDLAKESNKDVPYIVGYSGKGSPSKMTGLTYRLREVMGAKAKHVEDTFEYCKHSGLDPDRATVRDCIVHNLIHWTLKGSAPHMKEMMERLDGKVPQKVDVSANAKMSITDAVNFMDLGSDDYEVSEA